MFDFNINMSEGQYFFRKIPILWHNEYDFRINRPEIPRERPWLISFTGLLEIARERPLAKPFAKSKSELSPLRF